MIGKGIDAARPDAQSALRERAQRLLNEATDAGLVLTIEQVPTLPLAMGNYISVVSVRSARSKS